MATTTTAFPMELPRGPRTAIPWTIWVGVLAVSSSFFGLIWDVSWHRSVGRDAFLTYPHIMIYLCGVLAAVVCGYLIFSTTFGGSAERRAESVEVLGFRAPLGAFLAAWGGIAMLVSAPFDNWWHNAYGLDVKIISPPHVLLLLGGRGVSIGVLFLILAALNRSEARLAYGPAAGEHAKYKLLQGLFLYLGGLVLAGQMFVLIEYTWDIFLHGTAAYVAVGVMAPVAFGVFSRSSGNKWTCTILAGIYTALAIGEILLLPLVPASPKLGPVFFPVTHLVPAKFPLLLLVPAVALDLMWQRMRGWKVWQIAAVSGVVFIALLVAVEWPFASFLMSKASENRFFGTIYFDYNSRAVGPDRMREFIEVTRGARVWSGLALASVCAAVSCWFGLAFGNWMKRVQR